VVFCLARLTKVPKPLSVVTDLTEIWKKISKTQAHSSASTSQIFGYTLHNLRIWAIVVKGYSLISWARPLRSAQWCKVLSWNCEMNSKIWTRGWREDATLRKYKFSEISGSHSDVAKIQVLWDFTPCRLLNSYRVSQDRNAFIFRVKQSRRSAILTSCLTDCPCYSHKISIITFNLHWLLRLEKTGVTFTVIKWQLQVTVTT
jgi:hypothetical protein